jgi:hypothetical protein
MIINKDCILQRIGFLIEEGLQQQPVKTDALCNTVI